MNILQKYFYVNLLFVNKYTIIYLVPNESIERRNKSMVYFYSAIVTIDAGEKRVDGTIEIVGKIGNSSDWNDIVRKKIHSNIASALRKKSIESSDIWFIAFNPI